MKIDESEKNPARDYHVASRNSSIYKQVVNGHLRNYSPEVQRLVAEAPLKLEDVKRLKLPEPDKITMCLSDVISQRTSSRYYSSTPISIENISTLLNHANGVRSIPGESIERSYQRNVPSSGNIGSVETYLVASNIANLAPGVFHFDSTSNELGLVREGLYKQYLNDYVFYQSEFSQAPALIVLAASIGNLTKKYYQRGYRLALLDVGHVSQNIYLAATAMNLNVCAVAGFIDDEVDETLGIDGVELASMLVIAVGARE